MGDKYKRTICLLPYRQFIRFLQALADVYLRFVSFVHQTTEQAFGMIDHIRHRLSEGCGGIVAKRHDASVGNLLREEIFEPERVRFRVCPGCNQIAAESVNSHYARERL